MEVKQIKNIATALSQFQSECPTIDKSKSGYASRYKYAPLPAIIPIITPLLKKAGLTFTQLVSGDDENVSVTTVLIHNDSGETLETTISASVSKNKGQMSDIQAQGSVITYLRRYSLAAMLGIVTDEDIDGYVDKPSNTPAKPKPTPTKIKLTIGCESYNKAFEAYRDAQSNDSRNSIKARVRKNYTNAEEILTAIEKKYKEYLEVKNK